MLKSKNFEKQLNLDVAKTRTLAHCQFSASKQNPIREVSRGAVFSRISGARTYCPFDNGVKASGDRISSSYNDTEMLHQPMEDMGQMNSSVCDKIGNYEIAKVVTRTTFLMVLTKCGILLAKGMNLNGQLGLGKAVSYTTAFERVPIEDKVFDVALGDNHCVALTESEILYVWGDGRYCGVGDDGVIFEPREVNVRLHSQRVIAVGACDTRCAIITSSGTMYVCGTWPRYARFCEFVSVALYEVNYTSGLTGFIELTDLGGYIHLITVYEKDSYSWIYSFGFEKAIAVNYEDEEMYPQPNFLQMGKEVKFSFESISTAISIAINRNVTSIKSIRAGYGHILLLLDDGTVCAWGKNNWGQCGVDSRDQQINLPTIVQLPEAASCISAGGNCSACVCGNNVLVWGSPRFEKYVSSIQDPGTFDDDRTLKGISKVRGFGDAIKTPTLLTALTYFVNHSVSVCEQYICCLVCNYSA